MAWPWPDYIITCFQMRPVHRGSIETFTRLPYRAGVVKRDLGRYESAPRQLRPSLKRIFLIALLIGRGSQVPVLLRVGVYWQPMRNIVNVNFAAIISSHQRKEMTQRSSEP